MQLGSMARWGLVGSLCALSVVGCGSDSDSKGPESFAGKEASKMITAAEGGDFEVGAVALDVPAGALAEDTELTVKVESKDGKPDADSIAIDVYDFGPDGLEFLKPVTMEFNLAGVNLADKDAYIAWLDGSSWQKLSDSAVEGGKITATTTHFTPFTVVLVVKEDGDVEQTGGMCDLSDFKACGGDLSGSWKFSAGCLTLPDDFGDSDNNETNPAAKCFQVEATVDFSGEVTFADGKISGMLMSSAEVKQSVSRQCLADSFSQSPQAMGQKITADQIKCSDIFKPDADSNITVAEMGDTCVIESPAESNADTLDGTYRTADNKLYVTDAEDDGKEDEGQEYCVQGDKLTLAIRDGDSGTATIITAERK